ncbi:MAG: glycosyltransferase family 2 protein [Pseudomonadota bacterium]
MATVDEPLQLVIAFVAHHLSLGCHHIWLFLDRENPEVEAALADHPKLSVTRTDASYWDAIGEHPAVHVRRQLFNAQRAYREASGGPNGVDWLVHCDGDEFLIMEDVDRSLAELAALPGSLPSLRILNSERAWAAGAPRAHVFDGLERRPFRRRRGAMVDVFGEQSLFLRQGVLGYTAGKSFVRTGRPLFLGIHRPKRRAQDGWADHESRVMEWDSIFTRLIHFDGLTPFHWITKLRRKATDQPSPSVLQARVGEERMMQIETLCAAATSELDARRLHDDLRVLQPELITQLHALGQVGPIPIDIPSAIRESFPDLHLDLSEAGYDTWVRQKLIPQ